MFVQCTVHIPRSINLKILKQGVHYFELYIVQSTTIYCWATTTHLHWYTVMYIEHYCTLHIVYMYTAHCTCTLYMYIVQCTSATNWATIHPWLATTQPCLAVIIIFVQYYKGKPCRPSGFPVRIWSWFGFHPASWGRTRDQSVTLPPEILQKIILYCTVERKVNLSTATTRFSAKMLLKTAFPFTAS